MKWVIEYSRERAWQLRHVCLLLKYCFCFIWLGNHVFFWQHTLANSIFYNYKYYNNKTRIYIYTHFYKDYFFGPRVWSLYLRGAGVRVWSLIFKGLILIAFCRLSWSLFLQNLQTHQISSFLRSFQWANFLAMKQIPKARGRCLIWPTNLTLYNQV